MLRYVLEPYRELGAPAATPHAFDESRRGGVQLVMASDRASLADTPPTHLRLVLEWITDRSRG